MKFGNSMWNCFLVKAHAETHSFIIEWTQHIGFLILAEMALVVEGNHGNDLKER